MAPLVFAVLAAACGGREPSPPAEAAARARPLPAAPPLTEVPAAPDPAAPDPAEPDPAAPIEEAAPPPDFDAPLPAEPCAPTRVALAHRSAGALPLLTHAAAIRREDGRHVRVAIAGHPIERDALGRFRPLAAGEARFELDAVRTRRGPLEPGALGPPGARRGGLTHVRIVTAGARFTFGHRNIGRVELTEVSGERFCGRVDLDDGFGRVRGAFVAPVAGTFGE